MREIKFRAWDKKQARMIYDGFALIPTTPMWSATVLRDDSEANKLLQSLDEKRGDIIGGDYSCVDWADWYATENYEIMQFTGLLDKNGKEVYEGDILQSKRGEKYQVCWFENGWKIKSLDFDTRFNSLTNRLASSEKIIGNIYQLSDLVSETKQ